jgi:hypothetical protein
MRSRAIATHLSQIWTRGPATSLRTSASLLPQNEHRKLRVRNSMMPPLCSALTRYRHSGE